MTEFDNLIVGFKANMALTALWVNGNDQTDINTATGAIPTLAKLIRTADERLLTIVPSLSNRLKLDGDGEYSDTQKAWGRKNLDLDQVENTADVDKPLSRITQQALQEVLEVLGERESIEQRNVPGTGYFAYDGMRLPFRNLANTASSFINNVATAPRNYTFPDKDGVVAMKSDITGTNSGVNSGDETTASIKSKLGVDVLSGNNTGDETKAGLLQKLGATAVTGSNTGDETRETVITKIGFEVMARGARNAINGVAPLDENRKVPAENLPAAFDSVVTVDSYASLPTPGIAKRLYITLQDSGLYYWQGGVYFDLGGATGTTDGVDEGVQNLYFTQLRAIQSVLSSFVVPGNPTSVTNADTVVGAIQKLQAQVNSNMTLASGKEASANKATTFNTVNNTLYPTVQAVKSYADGLVAGLVSDRGNYDASSNAFPTAGGSGAGGAILKGNLWYVSVAGTLGGVAVMVGDSFRALVDNPGQVAANWGVLESNLGYVPYNATNPAGYISGITSLMVTQALAFTPLNATQKDAAGGVVGMTAWKMNFRNAANTFTSYLQNSATAPRNYTFPDKDGVVAMLSDLAGLSSGSNTGDETRDSIISKIAGDLNLTSTAPKTVWNENDQTGSLGAWRMIAEDGKLRLDMNTSAGRDFATFEQRWVSDASGTTHKGKFVVDQGAVNSNRAPDMTTDANGVLNLDTMAGNFGNVTGSRVVTGVTLSAGHVRTARFTGELQFVANALLLLPAARLHTKPDDVVIFQGLANGVVQVVHYVAAGKYAKPEVVTSINATTATTTLDLSLGSVFEVSMQANTTLAFDFSKVPTLNNQLISFALSITNDGVAGRGLAFPLNVKWAGGTLPPRTTAANARDDWYFYSRDGVNWIGSLSSQDIR